MLEITGSFFTYTDSNGNQISGYLKKSGEYVECSATFNGSHYSKRSVYDKGPIGWKRDRRGALSKGFVAWIEPASHELYNAFLKEGYFKK